MKKIPTILTIAALCGVLLAGFTGCRNPLDPAAQQPQAGYGKVTISLGEAIESILDGNDVSRTVYPGKSGLTCVYTFTKAGGQPQTLTPTSGFFTLEYGEWTVEVKAYAGTATEANLAAGGTKTFTVNTGSQTVAVELAGRATAGTGTFSYRIQYPEEAWVTSFTMWKLPELSAGVTLNYNNPETNGGIKVISGTADAVESGFYFVTLQLKQDGRFAGRSEVVHIYDKLTSEFGSVSAPLAFTGEDFSATPLTENVWTDGDLDLWVNGYSFTATADTQYIHVRNFSTTDFATSGVDVQVYDNAGAVVGGTGYLEGLSGRTPILPLTLTGGQTYYVEVRPYSSSFTGTYQITFGGMIPPGTTPTVLTVDAWTAGSLSDTVHANWYSFTANADTQFIHVSNFSTADYFASRGVNVQVYDNAGVVVGGTGYLERLSASTPFLPLTVTSGQTYYVLVTQRYILDFTSYYGTYQITFSDVISPGTTPTPLTTADTWTNGELTDDDQVNWYSFTATMANQYIYVENLSGDLASYGVDVQVYASTGARNPTLMVSQTYYIRVTPYNNFFTTGTYQIAFGGVIPPGTTPTALTVGTWTAGSLSDTVQVNWYSFTATADTQFIKVKDFSAANFASYGVDVLLYDSDGTAVDSWTRLKGTMPSRSWTLTGGQMYYIKVVPYGYSYSGTYRIMFNDSFEPPDNVQLNYNAAWVSGSISGTTPANWYSLSTVIDTINYIHIRSMVDFSVNGVDVQLYDSAGVEVGNLGQLYTGHLFHSLSLTRDQTYYIRVTSHNNDSDSGTYEIKYNYSSTP